MPALTASPVATRGTTAHWQLGLQWLLATSLGVLVGVLGSLTWVVGLAYAQAPMVVVASLGGAGLGLAVGMAQWLVLRRRLPRPARRAGQSGG